jgi:hypothetical protein
LVDVCLDSAGSGGAAEGGHNGGLFDMHASGQC